ncbi:ABC transporter ATP-binding protein [Thermostaphylospora chromogena]|uniref:ABC-2 type transport system ATP-binding protein n=1 Tax=Thermostaphylospora chromogena TaxID=35622 RepID=A0A1H1F0K2_9ACTN|nr:ABC transporter ATP-binding protein [Thermostaphylospora chromogena]SDQ94515.1 ABC-2 type transport system ATP-binding protein [Thermostaphylospora chromogena]
MTITQRNAVEVTDLRCRYGDFEAVRGISFTVRAGEVFALLGTNGAGKTTTVEVLEGFRPAHGGVAKVLGLDSYRQRRALRPRIGVMLQEAGFFGDLSVAETVRLWEGLEADTGRRPLGGALERVGLKNKARTKVRQLSGGQKRRLDLAMAIVTRPEVIFLDEPTTGMDPEARRDTWAIIEELRETGTTVLLTTHYLEEAERLADRLAIMHEGRIHQYGTVEDVVATCGDRISFRLAMSPQELRSRVGEGPPVLAGSAPTVTYMEEGIGVLYTLPGPSAPDTVQRAHYTLLSWADKHDLILHRLELRKGTLEDAFLRVVGEAR